MKVLYALVGQHHRGMGKFVHHQPERTPVTLKRDPENPYDKNAVAVWIGESHVGFVKATQALGLATVMDREGVAEIAGVLLDNAGAYPQIEVEERDPT